MAVSHVSVGVGPAVGALSTCFILGGLAVAKTGLGKNPVRLLLLVNIGFWSVSCLFPLQSSVILLTAGMAVYMLLGPVRRSGRTDHPSESCALRAPGPSLRIRPEH